MIVQDPGDLAIELDGVTKCYGLGTAVDDLSLAVPRGTTFGLVGPNGAGKSTTIKMLMGMLRPTSGRVRVLGLDVLAEPTRLKKQVGYVPEVHQIYRWMRVCEVIAFTRSFYATWNDSLCARLLDLFTLRADKKVKHLSRGMLAKLSLLLAVAHEPELLILDEPMTGLDPVAREEFLDGVLQTICEGRRTVLFSSHTLDDVRRLADTVGILYEGKLLACRGLDELLTSTKRIRAVLSDTASPPREPAGTVWQRVQGREWLLTVGDFTPETVQQLRALNPVENVEVEDLGFEDLFKDYVRGRRQPT
jgi:ABC-2 type transport system ATP-binding protein